MVLFSRSAAGLQRKLDFLLGWCRKNGMLINALKCAILIFGPRPCPLPVLRIGDTPIPLRTEYTYVGVELTTAHRYIFANHYTIKATKARRIAGSVFAIESWIGRLPPKDGKRLYMARVDPHLIYGCEVSPDIDSSLLRELEVVQRTFLKRLLDLNPHAMTAPLFSETGIVPLRYRRASLLLRYLAYVARLPATQYPALALADALSLTHAGKPSWFTDVVLVLQHLPIRVNLAIPAGVEVLTTDLIDNIMKKVDASMSAWVYSIINHSPKLLLLRDRRERDDEGHLVNVPLAMRQYMSITIPEHRIALTRMLVSDHRLATEVLRWPARYRRPVPPGDRLCRFCICKPEDPPHALFECAGSPLLVSTHTTFMEKVEREDPGIGTRHTYPSDLLQDILLNARLHDLLGKLAFDVSAIFGASPMRIP